MKREKEKKIERSLLHSVIDIKTKLRRPKFELPERKNLIVLPNYSKLSEIDVRYDLIKPFAKAHIFWDKENKELIYKIEEPKLSQNEKKIFIRVKRGLEEKLETSLSALETRQLIISYLEKKILSILGELGIRIKESEYKRIMYYVYRDFVGLNEIEPLMNDPYIEDIGCSGVGIPVFVVHSKFGSIKTNLIFKDENLLRNTVVKLAERCGKYISYAEPLLDGALPDGSRVNASFTRDVTAKGPTFSIRKFNSIPFSAIDLLDLKTVDLDILAYLWLALQYRKSILITGGTATGKTSFLNVIVSFIPPEDKIVSIEDTRELKLPHENWIPSVARPSYGFEEYGEITMFRLLKESFRQNPDYVIVGEVRGTEASVLFQGMASGHSSLGTIHASSPNSVIKRLITPPINLSPVLVETLDIIVVMTHAKEIGKSARRVESIHEIEAVTETQNVRTNQIFSWTSIDDSFEFKGIENSHILDDIKKQYGLTQEQLRKEMNLRKEILEKMREKNIRGFEQVSKIISNYYKDKDKVLKDLGIPKSSN